LNKTEVVPVVVVVGAVVKRPIFVFDLYSIEVKVALTPPMKWKNTAAVATPELQPLNLELVTVIVA
jgi:hypothetical protein